MWWLVACDPSRVGTVEDRPPVDTDPVVLPEPSGVTGGTGGSTGHTAVVSDEEIVATPGPGAWSAPVEVDLSGVSGELVYTTDGSVPEFGVSPEWPGPQTFSVTTAIRARGRTDTGSEVSFAGVWLQMDPSLVGFDGELPVLVFWSPLAAPQDKSDTYTPYTLTVFEPVAGLRTLLPGEATNSGRAGLRVRGSSSAYYAKHPYRIETWDDLDDGDRTIALLGMPEDGDWVLSAPADFDRALMRNSLMYALSNAVGRWAPRTVFAEVFVAEGGEPVGTDDYVGVYEVMDQVERDPDRVAITEMLPTDLTEPGITGGWLFKEDRLGPGERGFTAGTAGGQLSFQQPFAFESPKESDVVAVQAAWLIAELDELGVALTSPGFVHPITGRSYGDLVDVDSFVDHHVLNVYAKNPDAFRLSGYYHQERSEKLQAGPIWDFDRTLGCASDSRADDPVGWDASNVTPDCTYVFDDSFYGGLFDDPLFRDRYFARLATLLDGPLSVASVHAQIDAFAVTLDEAADRNAQRWPEWAPRGGTWQAEVDLLKEWTRRRHDWMAGCLALPDPRSCR